MEPSEDEGLEIAQEPPETSEAEELGEAVESEEEEAEKEEVGPDNRVATNLPRELFVCPQT